MIVLERGVHAQIFATTSSDATRMILPRAAITMLLRASSSFFHHPPSTRKITSVY